MTVIIRSPRGRWAPLSPAYRWSIKDRLKVYPSLLNYLADDCLKNPLDILSEKLIVENSRVISGLKLLMQQNTQFKNYLYSCPEIRYVNKYHPELEIFYTSNLKSAKDAISKYRIKGSEVLINSENLKMLGAKIEGDTAVFDYDAQEDVEKIVYKMDVKTQKDDVRYIANMIDIYIYMNGKNPEWIDSLEIINPNLFYIFKKEQKRGLSSPLFL